MSSSPTSTSERETAAESAVETTPQQVGSLVQIKIIHGEQVTFEVVPDIVQAYYFHDKSTGNEMLPHRLIWMVEGLQSDETLEIHLYCTGVRAFGNFLPENRGDDVLLKLFKTSELMGEREKGAGLSRGWTVPSPATPLPTFDSGELRLPTDDLGRINVKYSFVLNTGGRRIVSPDPGGNLIPDP